MCNEEKSASVGQYANSDYTLQSHALDFRSSHFRCLKEERK